MLRSETLFGKRDSNNASTTNTSPAQPFGGSSLTSSNPLKTSASAASVPASLDNSAAKAAAAAAAADFEHQ